MEIRNWGTLEKVDDVYQIWPHEERDFTPWLADRLHLLQPALGMRLELELVQREARLAGAGRVDILAREVNSKDPIVIENLLTWSDDDHFNRLMGYAAGSEAKGLIWIATGFGPRHLNILNWLNNAGVAVYALQLSAYRIGEVYAPWFEKVAGPDDTGEVAASDPARVPNIYGQFYRPLTERLRSAGIFAMGGRQGGWTGRYRSFRSGLSDVGVNYSLRLGRGGEPCEASLVISGDSRQAIYEGMAAYREELAAEIGGGNLKWENSEASWASWIWVETEGLVDETNPNLLEEKRAWMFENLVALRNAAQPRLEKVVEGLGLGIP